LKRILFYGYPVSTYCTYGFFPAWLGVKAFPMFCLVFSNRSCLRLFTGSE